MEFGTATASQGCEIGEDGCSLLLSASCSQTHAAVAGSLHPVLALGFICDLGCCSVHGWLGGKVCISFGAQLHSDSRTLDIASTGSGLASPDCSGPSMTALTSWQSPPPFVNPAHRYGASLQLSLRSSSAACSVLLLSVSATCLLPWLPAELRIWPLLVLMQTTSVLLLSLTTELLCLFLPTGCCSCRNCWWCCVFSICLQHTNRGWGPHEGGHRPGSMWCE